MGTTRRQIHERWLEELTVIPTAAGREHRVIAWVKAWVKRRPGLNLSADKAGNLFITRTLTKPTRARQPLFITAHLDHPAFVVRAASRSRTIELEFRGGVNDAYFENASIEIFDATNRRHPATIISLDPNAVPFKRVVASLERPTASIAAGDIGRWRFESGPLPQAVDGLLYTHACDDLAAAAAALSALDLLRLRKGAEHVGVILTRAEEVGFIGAIAACRLKSVPKRARLICLENSRSFPESPIGAGPIVRVGDKMSVFEPTLTNRIGAIMMEHQKANTAFRWQRKLMPGGTCEATTFSSFGYQATCVCLPLGNYHNMADIEGTTAGKRPALVAPEFISVSDYHGMIDMLVIAAEQIDSGEVPSLKAWMNRLYDEHGYVLRDRS
jgi:endoglucanase